MIGTIFKGLGAITGKVTDTINKKNELKHKATEMQYGYLKEKVSIGLFTFVAITVILPYFFWVLSPFLKNLSFLTEVLNDYETILNTITLDRIFNVIFTLLGLGGLSAGAYTIGKVKMAAKKADNDVAIKKEEIRKGFVGDDYVSLTLKEGVLASSKVKKFIKRYAPMSIEVEKKYGLPASAVLAHAALESGWGKHILIATDIDSGKEIQTNNMFNIKKSSDWTGKTAVRSQAWEDYNKNGKPDAGEYEKATFKVYRNELEAFEDYGKLITTKDRYKEADLADCPEEYVKALKKCGYMEDGKADEKMIKIMKKYFVYDT